jgi:hypothetical protein
MGTDLMTTTTTIALDMEESPNTATGLTTTTTTTIAPDIERSPNTATGLTTTTTTTIAPDMERSPNTATGLDTEMIAKTDGTLHTPDTETADTTPTADHATDTDIIQPTSQSMPVQARYATQTKQHGSSSKEMSIHPDWPSSSPTTTA